MEIKKDNSLPLLQTSSKTGDKDHPSVISILQDTLNIKRYSIQVDDSTGKQLTPGQQEFFKNSKAVDENGRLKRFYHGARGTGFTVFDTDYTDDGTSFFFTDSLVVAKGYSGNKEIYRVLNDAPFWWVIQVKFVWNTQQLTRTETQL